MALADYNDFMEYLCSCTDVEVLDCLVAHQMRRDPEKYASLGTYELILRRLHDLDLAGQRGRPTQLTGKALEIVEKRGLDQLWRRVREGWAELALAYFIKDWPNDHGVAVYVWLEEQGYLQKLLDRLSPYEACQRTMARVLEAGYWPPTLTEEQLPFLEPYMRGWYFLRNQHSRMRSLDPPGEVRRWMCEYCGESAASLKKLQAIDCEHEYEECPHCYKKPECAPDCPGIAAVLSSKGVHLAGSIEVKGRN